MKKLAVLLFSLAAVVALGVSAAAADGVVKTTETIGGSTAQVVYVTMKDNRVVVPAIANNSMSTDAPASSVISTVSNGSVVAAVNGGFFDSYYNASQPLSVATENYPRVYSTIMKDGRVICAGGQIAAVGMDWDGNVYIDLVNLVPTVTLRGETVVNAWGVNTIYNDPSAVYILTDIFDYPVNIPASSKIVTIQGNQVTGVTSGVNSYVVPDGVTALIYGSTAYANASTWNLQPAVGESAVFNYTASPNNTANSAAWNNMRTVIGGGGVLVLNGQSMVDYSGNPTAADQRPDVVGLRTFVAKTSDGRLMLGTVSSSFRAIANSLISMGVTDAVFMDGGASSMLYCDGSMVTSAGRKLATVLAIVDETSTPQKPDLSIPVDESGNSIDADVPSAWAKEAVDSARSLGILPEHLDSDYQRNITRKEFCDLIATFIRVKTGMSIEYTCTFNNIPVNQNQFSDSSDYYVPYVAALGIITGYPDGTFHPKDAIKRQDAAIMLERLAKFIGVSNTAAAKTFTDGAYISPYAKSGVDFVTSAGIMNGNADGSFSPLNNITREQAVITIMNAYDVL